MTIERLRDVVHAKPFRAFTVWLADGRGLRVRSVENIMIPPQAQRTFVVAESGEEYRIIDLLTVTSIDFITPRPRPRRNGVRRRR